MVGRSTGGLISSRNFSVRDLDRAIMKLPSSQRKVVRLVARKLSRKTGLGYYASLETVAVIGWHLFERYDSSMDRRPRPESFAFSTLSHTT